MKYGYIKDAPSDKDLHFYTVSNKFVALGKDNTDNEFLIEEYTPISNQGNIGSCVGNSSTDALEILLGQRGKLVQLSRLFTYYNARLYGTNATKVDEGTQIRNAVDSFKRFGVCLETTWPYIEGQVFKQPNLTAYEEATPNSISSYYRISSNGTQRGNDIETAIRARHPVIFGTAVSKEYQDYDGNPNTVFETPTSNILGGHAQLIVGVRRLNGQRHFYIRNSWGMWGIQGHSWMSENYITSNITSDLWVITLIPDLVI